MKKILEKIKLLSSSLTAGKSKINWRENKITLKILLYIDKMKHFEELEWNVKLLYLLGLTGIIILFIGPLNFIFRSSLQLQTESLDRGRTLVRLLAASNQEAFSENQEVLYSTEAVRGEVGVVGAFISDASGMILAPADNFGGQVQKTKDFDERYLTQSSDSLKVYDAGGGVFFLTYPILNSEETYKGLEDIKKGIAYIKYDTNFSLNRLESKTVAVMKFIILTILCGWGFYFLQKRWTLYPMLKATNALKEGELLREVTKIRFTELDNLLSQIKIHLQKKPAEASRDNNKTVDFWKQLQPLTIGDFLVLNSNKVLLLKQGSIGKVLETSLTNGEHILEGMGKSPHLNDLMQLILDIENKKDTAKVELKNGYSLKGIQVKEKMENYFVITSYKDE